MQGQDADIDLAALLCSRLCHDLISPVGAINNGLEMLAEDDDEAGRAAVMDLITQSADQASQKLQFFRLAFGAAGGFSDRLDMAEAEKAAKAFMQATRVTFTWSSSLAYAPKDVVKIVLNLVLISAEALIRGGTLTLSIDTDGDDMVIAAQIDGNKVLLAGEAVTVMRGGSLENADLTSRTAPIYLLAKTMQNLGAKGFFEGSPDASCRYGVAVAAEKIR